MSDPAIFVNIASYRDTECQWTVRDLFEKAAKPDRLNVGICWQFVPEEDADCFLFQTRPEQCRILEIDARQSLGACWARHHSQSLYRGEPYTLQIDSHMRFVPNWDEEMLAMLAECPPHAVISSYPPAYTPPDKIESEIVSVMFAREFDDDGILKLHSRGLSPKDAAPTPEVNPFIAAGFLFGPGRIIEDVRYDPHLYFHGEEISLAVRLWTSGWDIYSPNRILLWHDYSKRPARPRHWSDHKQWSTINKRSFMRLRHLLGIEPAADPEALIEIEKFGLGTARSLGEYEDFAKIDFRHQLIEGKTGDQREAEAPAKDRRARNEETFGGIWRANGWGNAETRSGAGSTLAATEGLRGELATLFRRLDIEILGDAGCGDFNWMTKISDRLRLYLGFDVVGEMIDELNKRHGRRRGHFFSPLDITCDDLPRCDAILCRDVLTHLSLPVARLALDRFKASGSRYLIATTHDRGKNARVKTGRWHPIDLNAEPFGLPPPFLRISEGLANSTKALGVWALVDLP